MKKLFICFVLLGPMLTYIAFTPKNAAQQVREHVMGNADAVANQIAELHQVSIFYTQDKASQKDVILAVADVRMQYKHIAFLLNYYFPDAVKEHINGAPLRHLDPQEKLPVEVEPRGLQVLDELVNSDALSNEKERLVYLTEQLKIRYQLLLPRFKKQPIEDFQVFEAMRLALVEVFTLGITGFDTPGSLNGIKESTQVLESITSNIAFYKKRLDKKQFKALRIKLLKATENLEQNDFETFDRLTFLTEYINPLYKLLLQAHQSLKLETAQEVYAQLSAWNFYSDNLFAEDFLNPYFFTNLLKKDDTEALRHLGEVLFYEKKLSAAGTISCASCHKPELAFTDGISKSLSNNGETTVLRNAPSLINSVYADRYFYDLRAFDLEQQANHVIVSHDEFATEYNEILEKLKADSTYNDLFTKTFLNQQTPVNRYNFSLALSAYVGSLRSFNSPFDQYVRGERKKISTEAKTGFNLFMGKAACGTCHFAPTFAGLVPPLYEETESEVLGVLKTPNAEVKEIDEDQGRLGSRMLAENGSSYEKSFKTVTVRNVELTSPYFHNGAYNTLTEVVDFYNHGGAVGLGLNLPHQTLSADSLHLSEREKSALIAFMQSLTDKSLIKNTSTNY